MNPRKRNILSVLATGVVVVVLLSLALFWMRWLVGVQRERLLPPSARQVTIRLSPRLFGAQEKEDPNLQIPFQVTAKMPGSSPLRAGLGVLSYMEAQIPGAPHSHVYRWEAMPDGTKHYYDPSLGLIVYSTTEKMPNEDGIGTLRRRVCYAGPEGVGETPDEKLGRFTAPVADASRLNPQIVYDGALRRFFAITWRQRVVHQGPQLPDDGAHRPVQIRVLSRHSLAVRVENPPSRPGDDSSQAPIFWESSLLPMDRLLVLDASGRIDLLDQQTLECVGVAGALLPPPTLYASTRSARLDSIAAYDVKPFVIGRRGTNGERSYGGCAVATLTREGLAMQLDVYDPNGRRIASGVTDVPQYTNTGSGATQLHSIPSARAAYFYLPGAQVLTLAEFTLESLHPPAFLLLSHLAAPHLDATAGYRSVFLVPDSFVAASARDAEAGVIGRFWRAFLLMCPAFLLAGLFVWLVIRDGRNRGLSKNARLAWIAGTIALGLPTYLTYRLTRPKVTLVTCTNCGKSRRPDMDRCHRCGSPWVVPELTPPAWRVLGGGSLATLGWGTCQTQPGAAVLHEQASSQPQ